MQRWKQLYIIALIPNTIYYYLPFTCSCIWCNCYSIRLLFNIMIHVHSVLVRLIVANSNDLGLQNVHSKLNEMTGSLHLHQSFTVHNLASQTNEHYLSLVIDPFWSCNQLWRHCYGHWYPFEVGAKNGHATKAESLSELVVALLINNYLLIFQIDKRMFDHWVSKRFILKMRRTQSRMKKKRSTFILTVNSILLLMETTLRWATFEINRCIKRAMQHRMS